MSIPRLPLAEIERQCAEARENPKRLPASWWEPETAEHMSDWILRFVPKEHRAAFIYGMSS